MDVDSDAEERQKATESGEGVRGSSRCQQQRGSNNNGTSVSHDGREADRGGVSGSHDGTSVQGVSAAAAAAAAAQAMSVQGVSSAAAQEMEEGPAEGIRRLSVGGEERRSRGDKVSVMEYVCVCVCAHTYQ